MKRTKQKSLMFYAHDKRLANARSNGIVRFYAAAFTHLFKTQGISYLFRDNVLNGEQKTPVDITYINAPAGLLVHLTQ